MANKILEKTLANASEEMQPGYAAPSAGVGSDSMNPIISTTSSDYMSVAGSARSALVLLVLLGGAATWSWMNTTVGQLSPWLMLGLLGMFVIGMITVFVPKIAPITAPIYALGQGLFLGAISKVYESFYDGIVLQALLATGAIVFVMYTLYSMNIIKVTKGFRRTIIFATLGIALFYFMNIFMMLFGVHMPLIWDSGPFGIIFSVVVIAIAAANLALDFDFIERGSQARLPKYMNWAAAFGLLVTIIWIYLEVLRLLAKTRN